MQDTEENRKKFREVPSKFEFLNRELVSLLMGQCESNPVIRADIRQEVQVLSAAGEFISCLCILFRMYLVLDTDPQFVAFAKQIHMTNIFLTYSKYGLRSFQLKWTDMLDRLNERPEDELLYQLYETHIDQSEHYRLGMHDVRRSFPQDQRTYEELSKRVDNYLSEARTLDNKRRELGGVEQSPMGQRARNAVPAITTMTNGAAATTIDRPGPRASTRLRAKEMGRGKSRGPGKRSPSQTPGCWNCGSPDNWADQCTQPQNGERTRASARMAFPRGRAMAKGPEKTCM